MSKTRKNHYVPRWYQEGFFEKGCNTLAYLDLKPSQSVLDNGRVIIGRSLFDTPSSRAFQQLDLYSTFFGTTVNDEIERHLFGDIDARGSNAVRAFTRTDAGEWHRHFQTLFEYIDIQKIRTPKGLDWLKGHYPDLSQNELMMEMQGIRMMHCTIWAEGVREIVSAEDSEIKFITSDHPVTIYNHAASPDSTECAYPNDPSIALKASQTIFPLNRDNCLILTNLEYARDLSADPAEKRTFARNYRQTITRTDKFIRTRKLTSREVEQINYILKVRARRYIAAGRREWLHPETNIAESWAGLRKTLLPPESGLWEFGGEMYVKYESGHVHYQDEFGRTEKERDFLKKDTPKKPLRSKDYCGCGYGKAYGECCETKPEKLRPTWAERSIRERNLMFRNGLVKVLGLDKIEDWALIRRELTDKQISDVYFLYEALWPLETDLLQLLPKPDGAPRAIYAGSIHPAAISQFALGASLYFGELMIQHPFVHPRTLRKDFNPVENPKAYRQEFLKAVVCFFTVLPLVEAGVVNLIPDPCDFNMHLREQMMHMAKNRTHEVSFDGIKEPRLEELMKEDAQRSFLSRPREDLRRTLLKASPESDEASIEATLDYIQQRRERDPLAILRDDSFVGGKDGGLYNMMKLVPNFEIAMYLAEATGSCIITDSFFRWKEIQTAIQRRATEPYPGLANLARSVEGADFLFPQSAQDVAGFIFDETFAGYPALMRDVFSYLSSLANRAPRPNRESQFSGRFAKTHGPAQAAIKKSGVHVERGRISCVFPSGGIRDNTVNRLLLMSSSEHHLSNVPMAFYIESPPAPQD